MTLFCCVPLGIAAIVFAAQVDSAYARGDYAAAQQSSGKAKTFVAWSVGLGLVVGAIYFFIALAGGPAGR